MFAKIWNDESGVIAVEYLFLVTIVGLALSVGFSNLASALNVEYSELSTAILSLDQSYSYVAASGCAGSHGGLTVTDATAASSYSESTTAPGSVATANLAITSCP